MHSLWVEAAIGFRKWSRSEIVPAVTEVSPLPSFDKRRRHIAAKVEVLQVEHQSDILPVDDSWQECIHQHYTHGGLRKLLAIFSVS